MALDIGGYCACSTEKTKTKAAMKGKFEHNFRLSNPANADPAKRELNQVLIGDDSLKQIFAIDKNEAKRDYRDDKYKTYQDVAKETVETVEFATGRKVRKDAVLQIEVVLTFSPSEKDKIDMKDWTEANVKWLNDYFGKDNVFSAVLHLDESTPHIHAMVSPVDRTNGELKFNSKKWLGGRKAMAEMQTSYSREMEQFGLKRGEEHSRASHRDIEDFHRALNKVVRQEPPKREEYRNDNAYEQAMDEFYRESVMRIFALEERIRRLEDVDKTREYNSNLYRKLAEAQIDGYKEQVDILTSDLDGAKKKAAFIDNIQAKINEMKSENPDEASSFIGKLNNMAKEGGKLREAIERQKANENDRLIP